MHKQPVGREIIRWGWTLSVFMPLSYLICVAFGLLIPGRIHMQVAWAPLLPGFEWLTGPGFVAGAIGSFLYGWYIAILIVVLYRLFESAQAE